MHPQHQNSTPVEGTYWTTQNHPKHPRTIAPRMSQRKTKSPERYEFYIVSYVLQVVDDLDVFRPSTYQEAISCSEAREWPVIMNEEMESLWKNQT